MKLKTKSLISVTLMTIIVSITVGYITIQNSDEVLQNNLEYEIQTDTKKIKNHISKLKKQLQKVSKNLSQSEEVLSSLNLISKYEDKNNYNTLIFDTEKQSLIEYSERFFTKDESFEILYYDKTGYLIAKKSFNDNHGQSGFITYDNEIRYIKRTNGLIKVDKSNKLDKELTKQIKTKYENDNYKIFYSSPVEFSGERIGYTKVIYYFGKEELKSLARNLIYPVDFSREVPKQKDFTITTLDKESKVYIHHKIDYSYTEQKRQELIMSILLAVVVMSVFMFFMFFSFLHKEILDPLQKLQDSLESILLDKYKPIVINSDDEIGRMFQASNKIFEKFWESYSSLQSYQKTVDTSNLVSKTDLNGTITYANDLFSSTSGYKKEEMLGRPHNIVRHPDMPKDLFKQMWEDIKSGKTWRGTVKNKTKSGGFYWTDAVISPTYDTNEQIDGYISIRRDITELMQSKEELEFRANYDMLTKLKNRDKLHEDLKGTTSPCLTLINIDRFSQINDFYGHKFGDNLLQQFSKILKSELDKKYVDNYNLYRYGGDEFAILVTKYDQQEVLEKLSNLLSSIEKTSITIEDKVLNINLSCGVSFEDSKQALLSADMALKLSKKEQSSFVVYSEKNSLNKLYENNLLWAERLKAAIEEDRIVPFFQPIVNNSTLAYEKYEALVRIIQDDGSVTSPFFFLDIAKQTKQYLELTKIMIEKSFEMFKDKGELEFSINLTMEDISNFDMREYLFAKFDSHPDIAKRLVLELVESESINDYEGVIEFINIVKSKGCKIAIDDFGSGYSNFEYLIKLQADFIKIDGSLIKNINTQKESFVVVSTIVNFAKEMGIKTIAEFIEDDAIFKTTKELGIDYSQGYHFSPPKKEI